MKLSFSLPSKRASRPSIKAALNFNEEDSAKDSEKSSAHEYITEFDPSETATERCHKKLIIPPKQNEWRPEEKVINLDLPLRLASLNSEFSFEVEAPSLAGDAAKSSMHCDLNWRQISLGDGCILIDNMKKSPEGPEDVDAAQRVEDSRLQKLKDELRSLPEDHGFEEFNDVPVESFGAALLAGYGWSEGRGIGRNVKEDVKVNQIKKRNAKEGLGFQGDMLGRKPKEQKSAVLDA